MTDDEYNKLEKELLEAYRVRDILTEEELDKELDALWDRWQNEKEA